MKQLGPEQLHQLWQSVERQEATEEEYALAEEKLLDAYSSVWRQALLLEGRADLEESLLSELSRYLGCADMVDIRRRSRSAASSGIIASSNGCPVRCGSPKNFSHSWCLLQR